VKEKKLLWHQVVLFAVMFLLTGVRLLTGKWSFNLGIAQWWLGGVLGFLFVFFDRLIQLLVVEPSRVLDVRVKEMFAKGQIKLGLTTLLTERKQQTRLVMRSILFVFVWIFFSIWTWTSVAHPLSRGFMLGLGTHLIFDLTWDYLKDKVMFKRWFWQIKREIPETEMRVFALIGIVGYVILAWVL